MMKFDESKLLVFLSSIILGILLASQLSFGKSLNFEVLSLPRFQQMVKDSQKLSDEIALLNDEKRRLEQKLYEYENNYTDDFDSQIKKFTDELNKYDLYVGYVDVEGPGVVVVLEDNPDLPFDPFSLVHDEYIIKLIWELKNAGAEAVSLNDRRVIYKSNFKCGGPVIDVDGSNDGTHIGDPEALAYALQKDNSYYNFLAGEGVKVGFKKEDRVVVKKYDKDIKFTYMKPAAE
jgi:uncharacterized protein YlxW (UPF0749 family)